jgi:hypothetical protein
LLYCGDKSLQTPLSCPSSQPLLQLIICRKAISRKEGGCGSSDPLISTDSSPPSDVSDLDGSFHNVFGPWEAFCLDLVAIIISWFLFLATGISFKGKAQRPQNSAHLVHESILHISSCPEASEFRSEKSRTPESDFVRRY